MSTDRGIVRWTHGLVVLRGDVAMVPDRGQLIGQLSPLCPSGGELRSE